MLGLILVVLCGAAIVALLSAMGELQGQGGLAKVVMAGYVARIALLFILPFVPFFTHGAGGDSRFYEATARLIATMWKQAGVHYVQLPELGATTLPSNIFAAVVYLNGGESCQSGCVAIVGLAAAIVAMNIYALAIRFGATPKNALLFATLLYFQPAFLFYTCDTYKDGLVLCFTMSALSSAMRLGRRFSGLDVVVMLLSVWALWYVRFYLVFVTVAPLVAGVLGIGSKSLVRPVFIAILFFFLALVLVASSDVLQTAADQASATFEHGTSSAVIQSNQEGGSGVAFDDGGVAYRALLPKLAYTLFSPFPWAAGSLGFQLGKVDAFLWYFVVYRAYKAVRTADTRVVLMFMTFIVPCTLMYAMSMSNVGLIVRQRLVIVAATAVLAAMYDPQKRVASVRRAVAGRVPPMRARLPRRAA